MSSPISSNRTTVNPGILPPILPRIRAQGSNRHALGDPSSAEALAPYGTRLDKIYERTIKKGIAKHEPKGSEVDLSSTEARNARFDEIHARAIKQAIEKHEPERIAYAEKAKKEREANRKIDHELVDNVSAYFSEIGELNKLNDEISEKTFKLAMTSMDKQKGFFLFVANLFTAFGAGLPRSSPSDEHKEAPKAS